MTSDADLSFGTEFTYSDNDTEALYSPSSKQKTSTVHEHTRPRLANEEESTANGRCDDPASQRSTLVAETFS